MGVGRKQKMLASTSKNYTKAEIEAKAEKEKKLEEFEPIQKTPPKYLPELAKKEYKKILKLLSSIPLAQLDQQILIQYCVLVNDYHELTEEIYQIKDILADMYEINLDKQLTAKRRQRIEVFREIKMHASLLGLTMESRMKLVPIESDEKDIMDIFSGDQ